MSQTNLILDFITLVGIDNYKSFGHFPKEILEKNKVSYYYEVIDEDMTNDVMIYEDVISGELYEQYSDMFTLGEIYYIKLAFFNDAHEIRVFEISKNKIECCRYGRPLINGSFTSIRSNGFDYFEDLDKFISKYNK